jgi:hypothetical protein
MQQGAMNKFAIILILLEVMDVASTDRADSLTSPLLMACKTGVVHTQTFVH